VRNAHTYIYVYIYTEREEAESDEAREQVGKRDALALSMRWKEEKEEEEKVGRQEALARDTRTRHTINTIFALPLHPIPPPQLNPIHPSIHPSRGAGVTEESERRRLYSLSLSVHTQPRVRLRT